jgi:ABC-type phosphate transport system substrate-binding protein
MQRGGRVLIMVTAAVLMLHVSPEASVHGASDAQSSSPDESLAIIVNQSNPVDNLTMQELRTVFLGERSHWSNGRRITLVMMEPGQPERKAILHEIYRMNENDFSRHFLQGLFTGEVFVSPKTLATPTGVRKFVFNVPGAIGYVRASDVDETVKVIRIDGHLPMDKDYSLRLQAHATNATK